MAPNMAALSKHNIACPCGSGKKFDNCCAPFLEGRQTAATAEKLMRSRYVAYVMKNESYLLHTWHESSRPAQLALEQGNIQWLGLQIIKCEKVNVFGDICFIFLTSLIILLISYLRFMFLRILLEPLCTGIEAILIFMFLKSLTYSL